MAKSRRVLGTLGIASLFASIAIPAIALTDFNPAVVAQKAIPAVVTIKVTTQGGKSTGSGFLIDASGTIVTNLHVIRGATAAAVQLANTIL